MLAIKIIMKMQVHLTTSGRQRNARDKGGRGVEGNKMNIGKKAFQ